jgi:hypothetical protein
MATVIRTGIAAIISAIKARLIAKLVVPNAGHIIVVAKGNAPPKAPPTHDILLRVGRSHIDWDGPGGRYAAKKVRTIGVYARTAQALDKGLTDEKWIDQHDQFEDKILNALLDFLPLDSDQNALTTECMHVVTAEAPDKSDDDVWGESLVTYEIHYMPAGVDPTDPG